MDLLNISISKFREVVEGMRKARIERVLRNAKRMFCIIRLDSLYTYLKKYCNQLLEMQINNVIDTRSMIKFLETKQSINY